EIPPFIETVSMDELLNLLDDAHRSFSDDDNIAFSHPLPVGIPPNAPDSVNDAQRRLRVITHLQTTRGRASLLEMTMHATGIIAGNGGWRILPEEIERRHALGLRNI
ncbi:MAG TPA: hypothetical protein VJZ27_12195, partial [Aggregatilineales bacterium]|nr:hypothetical protein [Aggregatilineales bacterium]